MQEVNWQTYTKYVPWPYWLFLCFYLLISSPRFGVAIVFRSDGMQMKIQKSEMDQYRDGASVLVASTNSPTCPVAIIECYYVMARSHLHTFSEALCPPNLGVLRKSRKISCTSMGTNAEQDS